MANQFFETVMGHEFYEGSVPAILRQLTRIADALEVANQKAGEDEVDPALQGALSATESPEAVQSALTYARSLCPEVTQVVFLTDGRWIFMDDEGDAVRFPADTVIDVGILEDAADALLTTPCAFRLSI